MGPKKLENYLPTAPIPQLTELDNSNSKLGIIAYEKRNSQKSLKIVLIIV